MDQQGDGATAAALDEAFSLLYGAAIGLALGSAVVSFAVRTGSRVVSGLYAGLLGYVMVLVPVLIATAPNDVSLGESVGIAAFAAMLVTPAILLGAAVGTGIAGRRRVGPSRRAR